jgi:hypothetical protein
MFNMNGGKLPDTGPISSSDEIRDGSSGRMARCAFAIIMTEANEMIVKLHDRMPVSSILDDWPTWLDEVEGDPAALLRSRYGSQRAGEQPEEQRLRIVAGLDDGSSALPSRLSQPIQHVLVVIRPVPWRSVADIEFEGLR